MYVKVCGLTTVEQIDVAIEFGYNAIGILADYRSPRYCPPEVATALANHARGAIDTFVVGYEFKNVKNVADSFDYIQLYKPEKVANLVIASKHPPPKNLDYKYFIFDASMGTSRQQYEYPEWVRDKAGEILIAGGISTENVCSVIDELNPFGIDISSGVEKEKGVKSIDMMKRFIETVRSYNKC